MTSSLTDHSLTHLFVFDIKEQSKRLVTFDTFDQSDERARKKYILRFFDNSRTESARAVTGRQCPMAHSAVGWGKTFWRV